MLTSASPLAPDEPGARARDVSGVFRSTFDRTAEGVFAAPGRVNLIGEHTDYNGGLCLPIALPYNTFVAVARNADSSVRIVSRQQASSFTGTLDALGPEHVSGWPSYVAGVIWALREAAIEVPGVDLLIDSAVPQGAGLSSSAALECAVALACCAAAGVSVDEATRADLVTACMRAEAEVAGAPTGGMDQTISLFARSGEALLLDFGSGSRTPLSWDPVADGLQLVVVDTRARHELTDGGYAARRADCEAAAAALGVDTLRSVQTVDDLGVLADDRLRRRSHHVVTEIARVGEVVALLEHRSFAEVGALFTASHRSLRDDFEVSCPELDATVEAALGAGALGARMTGGGFGGSAIALVPAARAIAVQEAVREAFAARGWREPQLLDGSASAGAHQLWP